MQKRPFLVLPDRELVPLEGPYRIERLRGEWYVLGEHRAVRCETESAARLMLGRLGMEHDAHALAEEALEGSPDGYDVVAQTR